MPATSGPLVLVVDDTPINRAVVCMLLNQLGCRPIPADSGQAAIEAVRSQPVDAVLMDCRMPGMDGFEATVRIRRELAPGRRLPIIALSGNDQPEDRERSLAAGMDDHITKPPQLAALRQVIARWLTNVAPEPPKPASSTLGEAILDPTPLASFDRMRPGSGAILLGIYLKDLAVVEAGLERAIADGDLTAVVRLTHKLKGASLTVGARALGEAMKDLGQRARDSSLPACREFWRRSKLIMADTRAAIDGARGATPPAAARPPWPVERVTIETLALQRARALRADGLIACMEAMPVQAILLNGERQIIAVNSRLQRALGLADASTLVGKRPGETIGCHHAKTAPDGCGSAEACAFCGGVQAVMSGFRDQVATTREARLTVGPETGHALELEMTASPIHLDEHSFVLLAMRDISGEKRRQVLERLFFHDVLNNAGGIHALASELARGQIEPELEPEMRQLLVRTTGQLIDDIQFQRLLTVAEAGELKPDLRPVLLAPVLNELRDACACHPVAAERQLVVGGLAEVTVRTDVVLFRRVLGNLIKNACEATPAGGTVTLGCRVDGGSVRCTVHNPGEMTASVQQQIFQRSFTTKGEGRGLGTWSAKLFGERYLGGRLSFTSSAGTGTEMVFTLPLEPA